MIWNLIVNVNQDGRLKYSYIYIYSTYLPVLSCAFQSWKALVKNSNG